MKGILPCVGWCRNCGGKAVSGVGVHSFVVELTSLVVQASHLLSIPINPIVVLSWLNFDISLAVCEPASVPLFLVGIMPSSGVVVV